MSTEFLIPCNKKYADVNVNVSSRVINIENITSEDMSAYCQKIEAEGFEKKEHSEKTFLKHVAYYKDGKSIFLNYFINISELNIAIEENCNYFSYSDKKGESIVSPQITQLHLEDFGMSYAIRVSDGRFIIIDGGWNFKPDAENLLDTLKAGSPTDKPVIAAWIMTHPHIDHYRCFNEFTNLFSQEVVIEKFLLNFPDMSDFTYEKFVRFPEIKDEEYCFTNTSDFAHVNLMYENIKKYNAECFVPHTGQIYNVGDAKLEFLSTVDDTYYSTTFGNPASLVFKMELGGQTTLWTGDASFSQSKLSSKYGDYLKSDILQVPHHGFGSGSYEEQIICYDLISPSVCLLPVSDYNAYTVFCPFREGTRHLMQDADIDELITGDVNRTITLPYKAPAYAKKELKRKVETGLKSSGSTAWVFSGLNSSDKEDFNFGFLNLTNIEVTVQADLYFDSPEKKITNIQIKIPCASYKEICIIDENSVELNPLFFNWDSFNVKEILPNMPFAVRFLSDEAIVVSHKKHTPAYHL